MAQTAKQPASTVDREIVTERVVDAPAAAVWRALTDPAAVVKWWGPRGFTTDVREMEVRPGGAWRFTMRGADGTEYPNEIVYRVVEPPVRLLYRHGSGATDDPHAFDAEILLTPEGGRTRVRLLLVFASAETREAIRKFGAEQGGRETLERLSEHVLLGGAPADAAFTFSRTLEAPRDLVWKAWTEPERLARWWGAPGMKFEVKQLDLRPGGLFRYRMATPDGHVMGGKFVYRDVVPGRRLVFVVSFCDEAGAPVRHPMSPTWPLEVLSSIDFAEEGGRTTLTMHGAPIHASDEEVRTFLAGRDSMRQGWGGSLDALARYLAEP